MCTVALIMFTQTKYLQVEISTKAASPRTHFEQVFKPITTASPF
jgi:hypothetical protein